MSSSSGCFRGWSRWARSTPASNSAPSSRPATTELSATRGRDMRASATRRPWLSSNPKAAEAMSSSS